MLAWIKALWQRYRFWIVGAAIALEILNWLTGGLLDAVPGVGPLLNGVANVAILIGVIALGRWLAHRFLFKVSRRLGLAFVFVGIFPLAWFALFIVGFALTMVLHLASHDSHATLEEYMAETAVVADRANRAVSTAPSPSAFQTGWQSLTGVVSPREETDALVWVSAPSSARPDLEVGAHETYDRGAVGALPGRGAPPPWIWESPFRGVVALGDTLRIAATAPGTLGDGRSFLVLVTEPVGARVAERIHERTGISATRLDIEKLVRDWRNAALDTLAATIDGEGAGSDGRNGTDEEEGETTVSMTLSSGENAESVLTSRVLDWATGELIDLAGEEDAPLSTLPLFTLEFSPREYIRAHFTETGQGGVIWLLTKVLGITSLVMMVLATVIGVGLTFSVTRAVNALHRGTKKVAEGDLDHRIGVKSRDQLGALASSFNEMTTSVKKLLDEKAEKDRLVHEMEIAAEVQNQMLPERFPTIPGLDGAARCMMAKEVGGDFYDFIPITPTRLALTIGDVSGKGVSAALVMSNAMSSLRSMLAADPSRGPAELLARLNRILHQATAPDRFVTLFYAEYDLVTANLRYANAGHDWPMVVSSEGQIVLDLESSGLMLGALPDVRLTEREIKLEPGDTVVAYSDGLVDTMNESGEPFERERVRTAIAEHIRESPARIVEAVSRSLRQWQGDAEDVDDVTIIVLRRVAVPGSVDVRMSDAEVTAAG